MGKPPYYKPLELEAPPKADFNPPSYHFNPHVPVEQGIPFRQEPKVKMEKMPFTDTTAKYTELYSTTTTTTTTTTTITTTTTTTTTTTYTTTTTTTTTSYDKKPSPG